MIAHPVEYLSLLTAYALLAKPVIELVTSMVTERRKQVPVVPEVARPQLLTVAQAAAHFRVSASTIRRRASRGQLRSVREGRRCWIVAEPGSRPT